MVVRHIFLWSVKDGHDGEDVLSKLSTLEVRVPGLLGWSIGRHQGVTPNASKGTWEYGLTVDLQDFTALDAYQEHPAHVAIVEDVMDSYADWVVIDYVLD